MKLSRAAVIGSSLLLAVGLGGTVLIACSSSDGNAGTFPVGAGKDASMNSGQGLGGDDDSGSTIGFDDSGSGTPVITSGDDDDDSGHKTTGDDDSGMTTGDDDSGSGDDDSGGGTITDAGADANPDASCKTNPTIPSATSTNFCYKANNDAGCVNNGSTPVCCDEGYLSGTKTVFQDLCVSAASSCTAGANVMAADGGDAGTVTEATPYECNKPADCAARFMTDKLCFLEVSPTYDGGAVTAGLCGKVPSTASKGTFCGAAGTQHASDIQLCTTQADCPTSKTCTAIAFDGNDFGGCL